MKHVLLSAAATLAAVTTAPVALAQTDPDGAMAAQREIATILARSRADFNTDIGTFGKVLAFSNEIRSPCQSAIELSVPRVERNDRYVGSQSVTHYISWRLVTDVHATNISDSGPGTIGVVIVESPNTKTVVAVNNIQDQQRLIAAAQRLRAACQPHRIQPGPLGVVGTWRKCQWTYREAIITPTSQTFGADIWHFEFTLTLTPDGLFTAQGTLVSKDPIYTGPFTASGDWERDGNVIRLSGTWTLAGGMRIFKPTIDAHTDDYLGSRHTNHYLENRWDGASCQDA